MNINAIGFKNYGVHFMMIALYHQTNALTSFSFIIYFIVLVESGKLLLLSQHKLEPQNHTNYERMVFHLTFIF
jgi:hypothetical protein